MIRAIIIDDEPKARKVIAEILARKCPNVSVIAQADSVISGLEAINKFDPELVLLDIKLTDGSGFDLLEKIPRIRFKIIFLTAYNEYAIKAIRMSALDYIMKPVNPDELVKAIERANTAINRDNINIRVKAILANLQPEEKQIVLKSTNSYHIKNISEIIRCEANGNYTMFYFTDGNTLLISKSLFEFEEMLSEHGFFRVHNTHLVNLSFIDRCEKAKGGNLYLRDNTAIPIARSKKQELFHQLCNINLQFS